MRTLFFSLFFVASFTSYGQDKYGYVEYNKLIQLTGTDYVIGTVENWSKMYRTGQYLAFINTMDGSVTQVDFPRDAHIGKIEQIRIDSLAINKVIVSAKTIDLDLKNSIDWSDPSQVIILSTDGKERTQVTPNEFFVSTWEVSNHTGRIVVTGYYDTNANGKYDRKDKNDILIYDLKSAKLVTKI